MRTLLMALAGLVAITAAEGDECPAQPATPTEADMDWGCYTYTSDNAECNDRWEAWDEWCFCQLFSAEQDMDSLTYCEEVENGMANVPWPAEWEDWDEDEDWNWDDEDWD